MQHPRLTLLGLALTTVLLAGGLPRLHSEYGYRVLLGDEHPSVTAFFPPLQIEAAKARSAAAEIVASTALAQLSDIAAGLSSAGAGFKAAAMIAENGQKDLLFPTLAGTAARGLELATQLKAAVEAVKANVANVSDLGDVPDAVDGLLKAFKSLKEKVKLVEGG